jgi:kynurenine formamidase
MKTMLSIALAGAAFGALCLSNAPEASAQQQAQVNDAALQDDWWVGNQEFGADDMAGAIQRIGSQDIMDSLKLVKQGKAATLGKIYAPDIPFVAARNWKLTIPGTPSGGPFGSEGTVFHDEYVTAEIGQVSTQFDGPGHIGVHTSKGDLFYGKRNREDAYSRGPVNNITGMGPLGTEHVAEYAYVCRGVLLNAAKYRGMDRLPVPDGPNSPGIITAEDVQRMVEQQGLSPIGENDCVFIYTGHGDLWKNAEWAGLSAEEKRQRVQEFNKGEPGFGISACEWLAEQKIVLTGGDTFATEAIPGENEGEANPCHVYLQTKHGIWNLENLEFTQLLQDGVDEFLFVWAPLKIVGGTGSPGNPVAIY